VRAGGASRLRMEAAWVLAMAAVREDDLHLPTVAPPALPRGYHLTSLSQVAL